MQSDDLRDNICICNNLSIWSQTSVEQHYLLSNTCYTLWGLALSFTLFLFFLKSLLHLFLRPLVHSLWRWRKHMCTEHMYCVSVHCTTEAFLRPNLKSIIVLYFIHFYYLLYISCHCFVLACHRFRQIKLVSQKVLKAGQQGQMGWQ